MEPCFQNASTPLVPEPVGGEQRQVLQPMHPEVAPPLAHDLRIGRTRRIGEHLLRPREVVVQQAPALEVNVVGVPVVSGAHRDHRCEGLRGERRQLQGH